MFLEKITIVSELDQLLIDIISIFVLPLIIPVETFSPKSNEDTS